MSESAAPRKISASEIEILGAGGETIRESVRNPVGPDATAFGNIRVFKGGPALLLLLPLLIPVAILVFFMMAIAALFFGKSVMKVMTAGFRRR